jgi:hypothetical protein
MRSEEEIRKQFDIYKALYGKCKELSYKPSQYWYLAKLETLLWVLGDDYARIISCELEAEEKK